MNKYIAALSLASMVWLLTRELAAERIAPARAAEIVDRLNREEFANWFNPADVLAVIEIESSYNARAYRYENERRGASLGLMQLLYSTARDRGLPAGSQPSALFDPETNIRLGMRQLKWSHDYLRSRGGGDVPRDTWIGSYNAGVGNASRGYIPLAYVKKHANARASYA